MGVPGDRHCVETILTAAHDPLGPGVPDALLECRPVLVGEQVVGQVDVHGVPGQSVVYICVRPLESVRIKVLERDRNLQRPRVRAVALLQPGGPGKADFA